METPTDDLEAPLRAVFRQRPDLHRFVIQDRAGLADHIDRTAVQGELFVTQITLHPRGGTGQYDAVYAEIARAIRQAVDARPAALRLLAGRTFVRALH